MRSGSWLGRKCAWQGWKERSPFRGAALGAGAALQQKPGRELSAAKRRSSLDFMALTSASNSTSTFHRRRQTPIGPQRHFTGNVIRIDLDLFGWNSQISKRWLCAVDDEKETRRMETTVFILGAMATRPASIRSSWS